MIYEYKNKFWLSFATAIAPEWMSYQYIPQIPTWLTEIPAHWVEYEGRDPEWEVFNPAEYRFLINADLM